MHLCWKVPFRLLLPPGKSLSILRTLSSNHLKKEGKKRSTPGFLAVTNQSHSYTLLVRFCTRLWRSSLQLLLHCWPSHCAQWAEILGVLIYIGIVALRLFSSYLSKRPQKSLPTGIADLLNVTPRLTCIRTNTFENKIQGQFSQLKTGI